MLRALGSASCHILHETKGRTCLRTFGSASGDMTYETGGTTCCGHGILCFEISHTRRVVRHETGHTIWYGHWLLRLLI